MMSFTRVCLPPIERCRWREGEGAGEGVGE